MYDQSNDDNWLEGAYLAQEEYDRDKDKWKGKRREMEDHFLSQYDTLPDTDEYRGGGYSSRSSSGGSGELGLAGALIIGFGVVLFFFFLLFAAG